MTSRRNVRRRNIQRCAIKFCTPREGINSSNIVTYTGKNQATTDRTSNSFSKKEIICEN